MCLQCEVVPGIVGTDSGILAAKHLAQFTSRIGRVCRRYRFVGRSEHQVPILIKVEKIRMRILVY